MGRAVNPLALPTMVQIHPSPLTRQFGCLDSSRKVFRRFIRVSRGRVPRYFAHVAQAEEHILGKDEVTGSNPVMGSS